MWAGLIQLIQLAEGLKRKKTTIYQPLSKREFTTRLPLDFIYNIGFSCLMALVLVHWLSSWVSSLLAHLQIGPEKPSWTNCLLSIYLLLLLFLWRVMTNTDAKVLTVWWVCVEGCLSHRFFFFPLILPLSPSHASLQVRIYPSAQPSMKFPELVTPWVRQLGQDRSNTVWNTTHIHTKRTRQAVKKTGLVLMPALL